MCDSWYWTTWSYLTPLHRCSCLQKRVSTTTSSFNLWRPRPTRNKVSKSGKASPLRYHQHDVLVHAPIAKSLSVHGRTMRSHPQLQKLRPASACTFQLRYFSSLPSSFEFWLVDFTTPVFFECEFQFALFTIDTWVAKNMRCCRHEPVPYSINC